MKALHFDNDEHKQMGIDVFKGTALPCDDYKRGSSTGASPALRERTDLSLSLLSLLTLFSAVFDSSA